MCSQSNAEIVFTDKFNQKNEWNFITDQVMGGMSTGTYNYGKINNDDFLKITGNVSTKNWGKLAIKIAAFYDSEILFDVPPEAFDIKPKVTSSFIRLIPKKNLNFSNTSKKNLFALIDLAFASRRKNIKNNLKKLNINWAKVDIDPTKRPEELTLESFIKLSEEMKNL